MTMGERIKELRKKSGMTQMDLAKKLGVTKGTISTWETGSRSPNYDVVDQMCEMFRASMDYLMGRTDVNSYRDMTDADTEQLGKWTVEQDLTEYALKYARLDEYGKQAVESIILAEFNRCRAQESLTDADVFTGSIAFSNKK
ncbi:MAG: helix-turn-helix transcriptional regulator [Eubacterium sp.]|nr:helix-turn-helix transcriptional regulator [Eubacterium sp.]